MSDDTVSKFASEASALARRALRLQETYTQELAGIRDENARLRAEIESVRAERTAAVQAAVTRIGRNPDTSRAMEEAFEEGRRSGLAEAADMADTYVFHKMAGGPIQLGFDRGMVPALQSWLAEHIRARAEGQEEPQREPFDAREPHLK